MKRRLTRLAERRSLLIARAEAERVALARNLAPWRARLALADRGVAAIRRVRGHPALMIAGAALLLVAVRPRRVGRWLRRGWLVWQIGQSLRKT